MNGSVRNTMEIAFSLLFFALGMVILIRSIAETGLILGIFVGGAFLAFGVYRLRFIWRYLRKGRTSC